jgi:hypothetical protein
MAAVAVSQEDSDRMAAYEADVRSILINGTSGGTPTLASQFTAATYDGTGPTAGLFALYLKATIIGLFRVFKNGPTKFPTQMPSYTVSGVPSAASNTGCMIYVTNETGGAVPAFSDGSSWRRVTDRVVIS